MKALVVALLLLCPVMAYAEPSEVVLQTIALESASEGLYGRTLVANVIRTRSEMAKRSPESVVLRPKAFSAWNDPQMAKKWLKRYYDEKERQNCLLAWEKSASMPYRLTHYHTTDVKPYWAKGKRPSLIVGRHVFYGGIK